MERITSGAAPKTIPDSVSPDMTKKSATLHRWRWLLGIVAGVIAAIVHGSSTINDDKTAPVPPPPLATITTAPARLGSIGYYVEAIGSVTPLATVILHSQINGRVIVVHYFKGQMVHRGDPLIDIDPGTYEGTLQNRTLI